MSQNEDLFFYLVAYSQFIKRELNRRLRPYGLTYSQFSVLLLLWQRGDLSILEIHKFLFTTQGNVSAILRNLEERKLIMRGIDDYDLRIVSAHLRQKGRDLLEQIYPEKYNMWLEEILSGIPKEDRYPMSNMLWKILSE